MTSFTQCYISCSSQNKADACLSLPGNFPLVEMNFSNSVVLKRTVGCSSSHLFTICWLWRHSYQVISMAWVFVDSFLTAGFLTGQHVGIQLWWLKRRLSCSTHGKLWLVHRDQCQHTRALMNTFWSSRWCDPRQCISAQVPVSGVKCSINWKS